MDIMKAYSLVSLLTHRIVYERMLLFKQSCKAKVFMLLLFIDLKKNNIKRRKQDL